MIREEEVYPIGRFNKPHGIHGEVLFTFTDDVFDRSECDYVVCSMDGILVPFFITSCRFRSDSLALIKLEGVETAEQAKRFTNVPVYFPLSYADPDDEGMIPSWACLMGFRIIDRHVGDVGQVVEVDQSTINTLFVVERDGHELLIPAQEDFITAIDRDHRVVSMDLPDGLLTLRELPDADLCSAGKSGDDRTDDTKARKANNRRKVKTKHGKSRMTKKQ